mgnify:CR=1 FL=1|jgi:hypothetical protein
MVALNASYEHAPRRRVVALASADVAVRIQAWVGGQRLGLKNSLAHLLITARSSRYDRTATDRPEAPTADEPQPPAVKLNVAAAAPSPLASGSRPVTTARGTTLPRWPKHFLEMGQLLGATDGIA